MISVVVHGRNDSHGYNLGKRAALCLNGLALQLSDPGDEIVFVDCNTPDALPTFPEAIHDTLTPRARELIRIIRIRPGVFARAVPGSILPVTEALSRNAGVWRTRTDNRFVLSTNTDMVFAPRNGAESLSSLAAHLEDRHWLLPRFDVPEWLWEGLDRLDPEASLRSIREWSRRFRLAEVCRHRPDLLFDSPGDFQLVPRALLFAIHGFDESMRLGWHVDANLCRRLYLESGPPGDLSGALEGFHLNHTLQSDRLHAPDLPRNDFRECYEDVKRAELPGQIGAWGLQKEGLEEIRLPGRRFAGFARALEQNMPASPPSPPEARCTEAAFNDNLYYDAAHAFPYAANLVAGLEPGANVAYWGLQESLAAALAGLLQSLGGGGELWVSRELSRVNPSLGGGRGCRTLALPELAEASLFLLDFHLGILESPLDERGRKDPSRNPATLAHCRAFYRGIVELLRRERRRQEPRRFVLLGHQNTLFEAPLQEEMSITLGGYACHVHHGVVKPAGAR